MLINLSFGFFFLNMTDMLISSKGKQNQVGFFLQMFHDSYPLRTSLIQWDFTWYDKYKRQYKEGVGNCCNMPICGASTASFCFTSRQVIFYNVSANTLKKMCCCFCVLISCLVTVFPNIQFIKRRT